jgi:hypothetical protein
MNQSDKELWDKFRPTRSANLQQRRIMADLMTKYYGVKHKVPCACPSTIKQIIKQLDQKYES